MQTRSDACGTHHAEINSRRTFKKAEILSLTSTYRYKGPGSSVNQPPSKVRFAPATMPDMPAGQLSVDHLGIVAWIENSRGTRFSLSQTRYEGNHVAVTINLGNNSFRGPATRPYVSRELAPFVCRAEIDTQACFRILWKGDADQPLPRAAICRVSVSPTIDKAGQRIIDATTYHIMDSNLADSIQSDVGNGGKSGFLLMPIRPDNNGTLEGYFLRSL